LKVNGPFGGLPPAFTLLGLFDPEDGSDMLLRNVGWPLGGLPPAFKLLGLFDPEDGSDMFPRNVG
jgi:hypothetical protein